MMTLMWKTELKSLPSASLVTSGRLADTGLSVVTPPRKKPMIC